MKRIKSRKDDCKSKCLLITAICKSSDLPYVRITWFDEDGIPDKSYKKYKNCGGSGDIVKYYLPLPPSKYTMKIDIPD